MTDTKTFSAAEPSPSLISLSLRQRRHHLESILSQQCTGHHRVHRQTPSGQITAFNEDSGIADQDHTTGYIRVYESIIGRLVSQ